MRDFGNDRIDNLLKTHVYAVAVHSTKLHMDGELIKTTCQYIALGNVINGYNNTDMSWQAYELPRNIKKVKYNIIVE